MVVVWLLLSTACCCYTSPPLAVAPCSTRQLTVSVPWWMMEEGGVPQLAVSETCHSWEGRLLCVEMVMHAVQYWWIAWLEWGSHKSFISLFVLKLIKNRMYKVWKLERKTLLTAQKNLSITHWPRSCLLSTLSVGGGGFNLCHSPSLSLI